MTSAVLNDLIARVKAEAAAHAQRTEAAGPPVGASPSAFAPVHAASADVPSRHGITELLLGSDAEFVENAYRLLLHREADDAGRANYRAQLARGASRLVVAGKLRLSPEGRRAGVPLRGLRLAIAAAAVQRVAGRIGLDRPVAAILRRIDACVARASARRFGPALYQQMRQLEQGVLNREALFSGLARRVDELQALVTPEPPVPPEVIDAYYLAFEDANRGSRQQILDKLGIYHSWLAERVPARAGLKYDVVDVGCGRGEWLSFVRDRGKSAVGVDANRVMTDSCLKDGFDARCVDALTFLRSLPTGSVAAVTGFHIIEHLPFDYLYALVQESYRVLAEGGSVLFETPNPENVLVGSHTFYHDFTHRNPVTPTAISFLLSHHGFGDIDIIRSSPYPHEAKVPGDDPLTARVNGHLCGPQDFAVTGTKGAPQEASA